MDTITGSFALVVYFPSQDTCQFDNRFLYFSIMETFHVYLLTHMLWLMLVYGRQRGLAVLLDFSWSASSYSFTAYF